MLIRILSDSSERIPVHSSSICVEHWEAIRSIESKTQTRYAYKIDVARMCAALDDYAALLGIQVKDMSPVEDYRRPTSMIPPSETLRLWIYKDKQIAVKYSISEKNPVVSSLLPKLNIQDLVEAVSPVDAGITTHAMVILCWTSMQSEIMPLANSIEREFEPVLCYKKIDPNGFKVLGVYDENPRTRET